MDSEWYGYMIEAGILGFFALMYYVFQRKRIIRLDMHEIFVIADAIYVALEKLDQEDKLNSGQKESLKKLGSCHESESFDELKLLIEEMNPPSNENLDKYFVDIKTRINFYK